MLAYSNQVEGKTIQKLYMGFEHLSMAFTDGTYTVFKFETDHDGCIDLEHIQNMNEDMMRNVCHDLVRIGALTELEKDDLCRQGEQRWKQEQERRERATLAQLKAKYEGKEAT